MRDVIEWLDQVRGKNKGTLTLSLRNHREDGRGDQVDCWDLPEQLDPTGLWKQIEKAAQEDADLLGGAQRYACVVLRDKDHVARRLFMVEGRVESGALGNPSAENALVNQLIRSLESKDRFIMMQWQAISGPLLNELQRMAARVEKLEGVNDERAVAFEQARSEQHSREIATAMAKHQMAMTQEVVHAARMIAPWAINEVAGKQLLPTGGPTPLDQSLKALLESLRPDQFQKLQGVLSESQLITVMKLWKHYNDPPEKPAQAQTAAKA